MKKILLFTMLFFCGMNVALAQKPAEIKFDKLTHDFGTFSEKNPVVNCTYGTGKFPGHFKKSITVRTNGAVEMTRLYIEGEMTKAE